MKCDVRGNTRCKGKKEKQNNESKPEYDDQIHAGYLDKTPGLNTIICQFRDDGCLFGSIDTTDSMQIIVIRDAWEK